jgi:hypothetical protein
MSPSMRNVICVSIIESKLMAIISSQDQIGLNRWAPSHQVTACRLPDSGEPWLILAKMKIALALFSATPVISGFTA